MNREATFGSPQPFTSPSLTTSLKASRYVARIRFTSNIDSDIFNMGGRLSMLKAADGLSETSKPTSANTRARLTRGRGIINGRVSLDNPTSISSTY